MHMISNFLKGLIIGIGAIAPGVSGGTFAVILGIYDKLTDAIGNFYHNFKEKLIFIAPLALGVGVGFLIFSNIIKYLFANYEAEVKFLFIGLMIGTLPHVFKEANKKGFKKRYLIPCSIAFFTTLFFVIVESTMVHRMPDATPGLLALAAYGGIIGIGTIVPGISSSFILMYLGVYEILLDAIVSFDFSVLIPAGLGFVLSILLLAKLITFLFKKFYGYTYYTILGFVVGSIITLIPKFSFDSKTLLGISLCLTGIYLSNKLSKYA